MKYLFIIMRAIILKNPPIKFNALHRTVKFVVPTRHLLKIQYADLLG